MTTAAAPTVPHSFLTERLPDDLRRHCRGLGIDLPASFVKASAKIAAARAQIDALPQRVDVVDALLAAVDAGRDARTDTTVAAVLAGHQLRATAADMARNMLDARERAAAVAAFDELVELMRPGFDAAAERLAAAYAELGDVDLGDAGAILNRGAAAAAAWAEVAEASKVIENVRRAWAGMALGRTGSAAPSQTAIVTHNLDRWLAKPLERRTMTPYQLLCAGWTLELHTYDETRAFLAEAEAEQVRRRALAQKKVAH